MKTIKLITMLFGLLSLIARGQGPYGQMTYMHSVSPILSSGLTTANSPGFLMAGYQPNLTGGVNDFIICVDKTDIDGMYNTAADFSQEFTVSVRTANNCNAANVAQITTCYGTKAIETSGTGLASGVRYAVVGSTDLGVFYIGLAANGAAAVSNFYQFPASATGPSKPLITKMRGAPTGNEYFYICGYYTLGNRDYMYLLKIDDTGAIQAAYNAVYDLGANTKLQPTAILDAPFHTSAPYELIITGTCYQAGDYDGFFIRFDDSSPGFNLAVSYDGGAGATDSLFSLNTMPSTSFTTYIVGGSSNLAAPASSWMMCIDHSTGIIVWSSILSPSTYNAGGPVVGVVERATATSFEYNGVCTTPNGMTVLRLDNFGNPVGGQDEFVYETQQSSSAANITSFDATATNNVGIHVYGTYFNTGVSDYYLALGCFNGVTGCTPSETIQSMGNPPAAGPTVTTGFTPTSSAVTLNACPNNTIIQVNGPAGVSQVCGPTTSGLPPGGSNARPVINSVKQGNSMDSEFLIFPNPARNMISVRHSEDMSGPLLVELENNLGQVVGHFEFAPKQQSKENLDLDLGSLHLVKGVYLVKFRANGKVTSQKIALGGD